MDGALYARAYNGEQSRGHPAAITQKAGRITSAGLTKDVVFETGPDRRGLLLEVPHQPVSRSHDRRAGAIGNRRDPSPLERSIQRRVTWKRSKFSS